MTEAQLNRLAKLVAKDLVENAFDIPADNARDFLEDLARDHSPVAKCAAEVLALNEGDDEFWDLREQIDVLIERARKAALATLKKRTHPRWQHSRPRLGGSKKRKR